MGTTQIQAQLIDESNDVAESASGKLETLPYSDLAPKRWREYQDILVESLWLLGRRDRRGPHSAEYWGNFVPQIPNQLIRRFTKTDDVVLDLFSGLGTTLIECRHLGRNGIGVELNQRVAERSRELIQEAKERRRVRCEILVADSCAESTRDLLREKLDEFEKPAADLVILHPPYHDIIKFSDLTADLSNARDFGEFLERFGVSVRTGLSLLRPGRFFGLVIGDKYTDGEWVPLGFECMNVCRKAGLTLKAINVKDIQGNERGKGKNENLWRYRALRMGLYIFKHEYVMVFRKE